MIFGEIFFQKKTPENWFSAGHGQTALPIKAKSFSTLRILSGHLYAKFGYPLPDGWP